MLNSSFGLGKCNSKHNPFLLGLVYPGCAGTNSEVTLTPWCNWFRDQAQTTQCRQRSDNGGWRARMKASINMEQNRFTHKIDYAAPADRACTAHNPVLCSVCDIIIVTGFKKRETPKSELNSDLMSPFPEGGRNQSFARRQGLVPYHPCIGRYSGGQQCIGRCTAAHGRCVSRCN